MNIINKLLTSHSGEYFSMTNYGYIAVIISMIILIAVSAIIIGKKQDSAKIDAKKIAYAGIALALAFITSYIKYELPFGGSITLFSMFFICFIGYNYGVQVAFLTSFAFSLLQFIQSGGSYFLSPFQVCCDYFFAFTALGIAGFWTKKKFGFKGLIIGYIVACLVRGLFHTLGGYIYWMDYMPKSFPKQFAFIYPVVYNYSYIILEMAITLVVLQVPAIKSAIKRISDQA